MKKLLLYLVAIITLGTMSVDALADKPIYVEWPNYGQSGQMTTLHFWYWNDNSNPKVAPDGNVYDYNGSNNKIKPNLFDTTNPATSFNATTVTGSDGKTYRKVMVPDNTSNIRFMANDNLTFATDIFDKVYVPTSSTVTQGSSVSEIFSSQDQDLTKNQFNICINGSSWQGRKSSDAEGSYTYENLSLTTASVNIQVFDKQSTEVYYTISDNKEITPGTALTTSLSNGDGNGNAISIQNFDSSSTYSIKLTYKGDGNVTILVTKNEGETPGTDYSSYKAIYKSGKTGWSDKEESFNASGIATFSVSTNENNGFNLKITGNGNEFLSVNSSTEFEVTDGVTQSFTLTTTQGNNYITVKDGANKTFTVTINYPAKTILVSSGPVGDTYSWFPIVNGSKVDWTSTENGYKYESAAVPSSFQVEAVKGATSYKYGNNGSVSVSSNAGNVSLYYDNNTAISISDASQYENFVLTFNPSAAADFPNEVTVNLKADKKQVVIPGDNHKVYIGGVKNNGAFGTNASGVQFAFGWNKYADDKNAFTYNSEDGSYVLTPNMLWKECSFSIFIDGKQYNYSGSDAVKADQDYDMVLAQTSTAMKMENQDLTGKTLKVYFVDGTPYLKIEKYVDPNAVDVTVYFVNRAGWGKNAEGNQVTKPRCFNWTDKDVSDKFNNGIGFPGDDMTKVGEDEDALKKQILGANYAKWKDDIWKFTLSNKYNEDGTFYRPKVIFSTGASIDIDQSRNLFLVANGIYTNSAGANESDVKASELLPARIINDEGEVEVYPSTFHNTKYSTIYTSDPKFLAWAKGWTSSNTQRIGIQLTYEKDGADFTCTGEPGTTTMVKTVINGKEFLRLDIAEDVIPDQTKLKHLIIWEESGIGAYGTIELKPDGTITFDDKVAVKHKLGNDTEGTLYDKNGTDQTLDGKHHENSSDHHECFFSDCPLVFTNVYFRNGFVYNRDGIHSILEEVKPDALYIVSRGTGEHDFTLAGYPGRKLTINGEEKQAYRINATELLGRPQYVIPDVPYQAYFSFVGLFNNYIEEGSTEATEKYILYAFPFEGENTYTNNKALYPGKPEAISADDNGFYSINRNGQEYEYYDVTVDWLTPSVSIAPAKQDAEFMLAIPNDAGVLEPRQNGFLYMYAMADNEYPVNPYTGEILYKNKETGKLQPVTEASELRSRLCVVKYNNNIEDESFFDNVTVSMTRTNDYERYFRNNTANKPAYVMSTVEGEGYVRSGKALHAHKTPKGEAETGNKYRDVHLRAHTAGVAIVRITQDKAVTLSDGATYNPTEYSFPVRILPTPSSIGLELNGHGIYALDDTGNLDLDPMTGQAPSYQYGVTNNQYSDKKTPGQIWTRECIKMEPNGCAYEVEDNDGQMMQTVKIYWDYMKPAEASRSRRSVVEAQASALTAYDVYYPIAFTEEQRFSRTHAISETKLKQHDNTVYMQIVHNGVVSPVYTVKVNAGEDVPTDVNEVEVAEEVEPVYYNLNGVRVNGENLSKGIYVKVTGNRTEKIFVK